MGDYVWGVDPSADWGQDLSPMQDSYNYDSGDFWENDSAWDDGWNNLFQTTQDALQGFDNAAINNDLDQAFADNNDLYAFDDGGDSFGSKALSFLGSKNGLSLLGGALAGGMKMYGQNKNAKVSAKSREEERKFQKELLAQKEAHDKEILAMRLAAQGGGGGPDRPAPGTAEKTTTALGAHKVRW